MVSSIARIFLLINFGLMASAIAVPRSGRVVGARAPAGTQFITGACSSDADCASGCCSAANAECAARLVALEGAGCGGGSGAAPATAVAAAATPTGTQFITGACSSDADCASGCCSAANAQCAARLVALQGAGCGGGSGAAASVAPAAAPSAPPTAVAPAVSPTGTQFITGACTSDADCASGCCSAANAQCAARLVALQGAGCGGGSGASAAAASSAAAPPAVAPPAAAASTVAAAATPTGTQFITGACSSDADCASGCCSAANAQCAARLVALQGAGCGGGSGAAAASPAAASPATAAAAAASPTGTQFITGVCASDADCASGCCAKANGQCAARLVALQGAGCGGGSATA
ncbi:Biotrophy-associated secreted protein 2 [Mycena sanguinolenta]|uniref:Biotrophy-associated secreted protein 2 n=1 Tax=Mycena sanguinolenta TaxID=230812 RepID=A0A8H6ZDI1_9AGAR|nr:Biotrophy-associated secreted protein 2 [Mycena sanguinolenta]